MTGDSGVLTTTSVNISGEIRARGASVEAWIDYSTDGINFDSVRAVPATVDGDTSTRVDGELRDLLQGVTYYYRVRAIGPFGQGVGETKTLDVESLSGLIQQFPPGLPAAERLGSVNITLDPEGIGGGWRFAGEPSWRGSGEPATGLTGGDRVIEYRPVPGHIQPATETITVVSAPEPLALTRTYVVTEGAASGSLTVILKPQDLTEGEAPARWRFFGEGDDAWKESGTTVEGLVPGSYVILSKPVAGRATPTPVTAVVAEGETTTLNITYRIEDELIGEAPAMIPFDTFSTDTTLPNAFVGQIRGDAGSGTGFVVRPRVVATVGHVVFNDGTLAATTGLQWLFQNDRGAHEPVPVVPRGSYLMTGYAAQRAVDNSPGVSSPASQNLDAATMFFLQDVGRGGFSGYLASDTSINEFLVSDALKTLAGYPVDGIPEADLDRLHATPPMNVLFSKAFGRTYITQDIRATGGASGGPLCVLSGNGAYYPAAIYLGGTGQTVVRAIDSEVVALIAGDHRTRRRARRGRGLADQQPGSISAVRRPDRRPVARNLSDQSSHAGRFRAACGAAGCCRSRDAHHHHLHLRADRGGTGHHLGIRGFGIARRGIHLSDHRRQLARALHAARPAARGAGVRPGIRPDFRHPAGGRGFHREHRRQQQRRRGYPGIDHHPAAGAGGPDAQRALSPADELCHPLQRERRWLVMDGHRPACGTRDQSGYRRDFRHTGGSGCLSGAGFRHAAWEPNRRRCSRSRSSAFLRKSLCNRRRRARSRMVQPPRW